MFCAGESFPHDRALTEAEVRVLWVEESQTVMEALAANGAVVGTYYLRPNSLCLGAHVTSLGLPPWYWR
ncbi:MAG: hypothetical protein DCF23_07330 [Cyanobium sp.]|nr:MAG: hypothetical protein DCF23_07330 [Cyanobium sp.]